MVEDAIHLSGKKNKNLVANMASCTRSEWYSQMFSNAWAPLKSSTL